MKNNILDFFFKLCWGHTANRIGYLRHRITNASVAICSLQQTEVGKQAQSQIPTDISVSATLPFFNISNINMYRQSIIFNIKKEVTSKS